MGRESVRMSADMASAKVSVSLDKLKEWEEGTNQRTFWQGAAENIMLRFAKPENIGIKK